MSKIVKFIIVAILLLFKIYIFAYQWPLKVFNTEKPITGVLGEFRVPYGSLGNHFHSGIDIQSSSGTAVYSITDGYASVVDKATNTIRIGDYNYVHIIPAITIDKQITAYSTIIGHIQNDHLHFSYYIDDAFHNPLQLFDNYEDTMRAVVFNPTYWRQKETDSVSYQQKPAMIKIFC